MERTSHSRTVNTAAAELILDQISHVCVPFRENVAMSLRRHVASPHKTELRNSNSSIKTICQIKRAREISLVVYGEHVMKAQELEHPHAPCPIATRYHSDLRAVPRDHVGHDRTSVVLNGRKTIFPISTNTRILMSLSLR
jgi:hypothetical protein